MREITLEKLSSLITTGESEIVEFKETFGDEALETVGAFANTQGGTLLIGIKDSGDICGFSIGKKTLEDIAHRIQEITDPRLHPSISTIKYKEKSLVVIQTTKTTQVPISVRGRYFRRTGRTNQRMSHEEIMHRMIVSTGLTWDTAIEPNATLEDLDLNQVQRFVQTIKNKGRLAIPTQANDQEILKKLDLIRNNLPTRAALLLFGINPESYFSSAFLKLGRFRSPTHIVDDREVHGSLINQLDGAMSWFRERLETEFEIIDKAERNVYWEYPLEAIREAIINVLIHRDYTSWAHSQIRLHDDRLDFGNAGSLPPTLTAEGLFHEHDSIPRNRKIAEAFFYAGFIERWGSGTLKIAEELQAAGLPAPKFESTSGHFRLRFYKKQHLEQMGLSERQLKAIAYVKEHGQISNAEYQTIAAISSRTAIRELNELQEKGILVSKGSGRGTMYKINAP